MNLLILNHCNLVTVFVTVPNIVSEKLNAKTDVLKTVVSNSKYEKVWTLYDALV